MYRHFVMTLDIKESYIVSLIISLMFDRQLLSPGGKKSIYGIAITIYTFPSESSMEVSECPAGSQ
jgi:hypothetical protein